MRPSEAPAAPETRPAGLAPRDAIARYDRIAGGYDLWAGLFEGKSRRRMIELASLRDGEAVLEVAVGTGSAYAELAATNPHGLTIGIDASPRMLGRARLRAGRQEETGALLLADCRAVPLKDARFDVVMSAYLLDLLSIEDMGRSLHEMYRVLRPEGRLVLVSMTHDGPLMRLWSWVYERSPGLLGGCRSVFASPLVSAAGFADVRREVVRQLGFPSEIVTGRRIS